MAIEIIKLENPVRLGWMYKKGLCDIGYKVDNVESITIVDGRLLSIIGQEYEKITTDSCILFAKLDEYNCVETLLDHDTLCDLFRDLYKQKEE